VSLFVFVCCVLTQLPVVDCCVASSANDQGLALARSHMLDPSGLGSPPVAPQVLEGADVVDLDLFP
jgi:hypothetical protein